jgi:hypothetical protein
MAITRCGLRYKKVKETGKLNGHHHHFVAAACMYIETRRKNAGRSIKVFCLFHFVFLFAACALARSHVLPTVYGISICSLACSCT